MKQHPKRTLVVYSSTLCALLVSICPDTQAADPAALRAKAKEILGVLPDKMPGAEKDTPAMVTLGEKLYFEKRLSINNKMACNDCHHLDQNGPGADNQPTSEGAHGKRGERNSPTTLNAGFHFAQFWDGRAKDLEEQAKGPVLNPVEMAMPSEDEVVKRLSVEKEYPKLFQAAFPQESKPVTYDNFARAVAAFERTLRTHDRFDDFLKGEDQALNTQELRGLDLLLNTGCTTCHQGPAIGGSMYQKIGLIHPFPNTNDVGRMKITKEEGDAYRFKVPSLRNVALTAPYFHDGSAEDLETAIKQMAYLQLGKQLPGEDVAALKAFLTSLSDKNRRPVKVPAGAAR